MKRILVSNDDGVHAGGITALAEAMEPLGEVTVVAPLTEQSATSHSLTLHHPLRIKELGPRRFAVQGTPTDCVLLAIHEFLDHRPDLVVSGINQGPNMGEDVVYSGTVAAAMEGALLGVPAVAFSLASWRQHDFEPAARVARLVVAGLEKLDLPRRFLLSVNIPPLPYEEIRGFQVTRLGTRVYQDAIVRKTDPRGRDYFWIGGAEPTWTPEEGTDFSAVESGYVSLTPLGIDLTHAGGFDLLETLVADLPC